MRRIPAKFYPEALRLAHRAWLTVIAPYEDGYYAASNPQLPGCRVYAKSPTQAAHELIFARIDWIAFMLYHGEPINAPPEIDIENVSVTVGASFTAKWDFSLKE